MPKDAKQGGLKTTTTALEIIEYLCEQRGARVTEISSELGIAKSTVHRHLSTLLEEKYVIKDGDQYRLSLQFLYLGIMTRRRNPAYELIEEKVEELAQKTGERVQFVLEEHGKAVWLYQESGENAVRTNTEVGKYVPLHVAAAGKAILAHLPEERVEWIIETHGLTAITEHSITDREELYAELDDIREKGFAVNNQENMNDLRAFGVPVMDQKNQVLGAFSVSGPTNRMDGEWFRTDLRDLLLGTANEVELNIRHLKNSL